LQSLSRQIALDVAIGEVVIVSAGRQRPRHIAMPYGGAVISEAGTHERVAALVYICAFAPDAGESVSTLIGGFPAGGPQPPILAPVGGFSSSTGPSSMLPSRV
jgi:hypothetical protein